MLEIDLQQLPTSAELPCSDDIPVDNEDQNWLPNILLFLLEFIWRDRQDWFFAVDMGSITPLAKALVYRLFRMAS